MLLVSEGVQNAVEVDTRSPVIAWQTSIVMFILASVGFAIIRPYKSEFANHSGMCLTALLAVCSALLMDFDTAAVPKKYGVIVADVALLSLPHIVFYGYLVHQLGKLLKQSDINFKAALELLCFRQSRKQSEESPLLNHAEF